MSCFPTQGTTTNTTTTTNLILLGYLLLLLGATITSISTTDTAVKQRVDYF